MQGFPPRALVLRMGGHPATSLGLDLDDDADVARWWVVALLGATRGDATRVETAARALAGCGLDTPAALAAAPPERVQAVLAEPPLPRPDRLAALLVRASRNLCERHAGAPGRLAASAWDLDALGAALTRLAPGLGAATALRFLRPLRERWAAAREAPLAPASRAAAVHLGWIAPEADAEGEPGALAAFLRACDPELALADVEAALERLGAAACVRGRTGRCPLAEACPARGEAAALGRPGEAD